MRNLNFLKQFYLLMLVMVSAAFVSCVDDNDDTEAPFLKVSPTTLTFGANGQPTTDGQASFTISTNRSWTATVKDDKTWVTLSKYNGEGDATIQVSIPEGINDQASVFIEISNKVGTLMSETVTIKSGSSSDPVAIYKETVGSAAVSSPWPFVDKYEGWNKSGAGAAGVTYTGGSASVRSTGLANTNAYEGASGPNVVFFGTLPSHFVINEIALAADQTNLRLSFGASYSYKPEGATDYVNTFDIAKFTVSLSADGTSWTPITYTKNDGDTKTPYWVTATSDFTLKQATSKLFIKFTALAASAIRLDDITLSTGNGGTVVDLGSGGGETPELAEKVTISELIAKMTPDKVVLDADADHYLEAVVQNDVAGGNYSFNNLILATENATTAKNGITLYGSQVEPSTLSLNKGDKVKVTLYKGLAQLQNYNGMYEITGEKDAAWAKVEKIGTAAIAPLTITADKLAEYQGMTVTIQNATTAAAGIWANADGIAKHTLSAAGTDFTVFCKKGATAFIDVPFKAATGAITGLAAVNSNAAQIVPRNLDDVKAFNSSTPMITSVDPTSLSFPAAGGTKTIEVSVANQNSPILTVSGLSGILNATVSGTTVTVVAGANTGEAVNQTLAIALQGGNSVNVAVSISAPTAAGGYTLISNIDELTAGKYLMSGYAEKNNSNVDLTPYFYQVWTGALSFTGTGTTSNSDLVTVSYEFANSNLTPKEEAKVASEMELVAVAGKTNTYYIKVDGKYLYNSVEATNRRLYLKDEAAGAEWEFMNKSNGDGITASNNKTWIITAGADSNFLRSYKTETQTKVGFFFFKKN